MRWRLFPLFELAMRLAERDMTELVAGGNKHGPNGGNIGHEGRDVNTGFGGDRSLSARALTPDMSTSDDVWSVGGGRRSWGVKTERLTPTPLAMTNPLQRRLVIGLATACLAASVVALPSAAAQDDSRAQLTTSGMMGDSITASPSNGRSLSATSCPAATKTGSRSLPLNRGLVAFAQVSAR